ncbi:exopolysaccharide biosynthesis polyprenyl glycosylphosphotransferase, partial [Nocardioides aestuarii]
MTQLSLPPTGQLQRALVEAPATLVDRLGVLPSHRGRSRSAWRSGVVTALTAVAAATAALGILALATTPLDLKVALFLLVMWPVMLGAQGCFVVRHVGDSLGSRAGRVVRAGGALGLLSWVMGLLIGSHAAPVAMIPATLAVTGSGLVTTLLRTRRRTRVVLTGTSADVAWAATELLTRPDLAVVGACVSDDPSGLVVDYPVLPDVSRSVEQAVRQDADVVVMLPGPGLGPAQVRRLQWEAGTHEVGVYVGTGLLDVAPFRMSLTVGGGLGLVQVRPTAHAGARRLLKDVAERLAAAAGLLLLSPLLLAVAAAIRFDSPGPALFSQQRVGRDGRLFTIWKFRTMSTSAETDLARLADDNEGGAVLFKIRTDPRITRLGGALRRYSIDELPQLWNVVVGDMSLVGPRPALPQEVAQYDVDPRRRLAVKPGLTGLWQVSGRSDLDWDQTVRLDLRYVDNWSLRLDVVILVRTLRAVL